MSDPAGVIVMGGPAGAALAVAERLAARQGSRLITTTSSGEALEALDRHGADVLLVPCDASALQARGSAHELLATARGRWPDLPVIALCQPCEGEDIVRALAAGASDAIAQGAEDELALALRKALSSTRRAGKAPPPADVGPELVLGGSRAMRAVAELLERIGPSSASVLVRGESGTGKELVARALHRKSPLAHKPFIKIDCASLPDSLLESELFGYERGAFTGATARKLGRVELAQGGTLFLDEAGELSLTTQAKLLRLLQDREFERLGGTATLRVDVRVIAATHRDLETMVTRGQFRQDLFYRLNVVPIWLPPLRARRDDVAELAQHFCREAAQRNARAGIALEPSAVRLLSQQRWPGNVRQLQNFVERLVVLCPASSIGAEEVQAELERPVQFLTETGGDAASAEAGSSPTDPRLSQIVRDAERQALLRAIDRAGGNRSAAARVLGVSRTTFYAKLREHGLL